MKRRTVKKKLKKTFDNKWHFYTFSHESAKKFKVFVDGRLLK